MSFFFFLIRRAIIQTCRENRKWKTIQRNFYQEKGKLEEVFIYLGIFKVRDKSSSGNKRKCSRVSICSCQSIRMNK